MPNRKGAEAMAEMTPEPTDDDQPPYFRDPAEAPEADRPAEHLEPEDDEEESD